MNSSSFLFCLLVITICDSSCYQYRPVSGNKAYYTREDIAPPAGGRSVYQFKLKGGEVLNVRIDSVNELRMICTKILSARIKVPESIRLREIKGFRVRRLDPVKSVAAGGVIVMAGIFVYGIFALPIALTPFN